MIQKALLLIAYASTLAGRYCYADIPQKRGIEEPVFIKNESPSSSVGEAKVAVQRVSRNGDISHINLVYTLVNNLVDTESTYQVDVDCSKNLFRLLKCNRTSTFKEQGIRENVNACPITEGWQQAEPHSFIEQACKPL